MEKLRRQECTAANPLEFNILTAARLTEARNATVQEIDHANKVWTVPSARMKGGKEHRVPLPKRALELATMGSDQHLFPSPYFPGKAISEARLRELLRQLGHGDVTIHGFRSTFKDWARDRTRFDNYVVEAALAHLSGDKVEQAYARSDVMEKRQQLMNAWAKFCEMPPAKSTGKVVSMRSAS